MFQNRIKMLRQTNERVLMFGQLYLVFFIILAKVYGKKD